jgi:hypothetical protein
MLSLAVIVMYFFGRVVAACRLSGWAGGMSCLPNPAPPPHFATATRFWEKFDIFTMWGNDVEVWWWWQRGGDSRHLRLVLHLFILQWSFISLYLFSHPILH